MASRTPGKTTQGKIGDMKVEETTMMPNVPNQELPVPERPRADDVINFEGLPSKNAREVAQEIVISYNPKRPKK